MLHFKSIFFTSFSLTCYQSHWGWISYCRFRPTYFPARFIYIINTYPFAGILMIKPTRFKLIVFIELCSLFGILSLSLFRAHTENFIQEILNQPETNWSVSSRRAELYSHSDTSGKDFIKWVDFKVTSEAMNDAYQYDLQSHDTDTPLDWVCLLAVLGCKYGGDFKNYNKADLTRIVNKLLNKESTLEQMTQDMKYYDYYNEAYHAVLGGFVGEYRIPGSDSEKIQYGLKAFSPIAKGFPYSDYDDFGSSRSFGYRRQHLGHDMMGQIGTPIIAVESGYVECLGWNRYGGWRIGIRSFDKKRYYYYAHLRQNFPYCKSLKEGSTVTAGDVIGYMGHTGYSDTENTNNIDIIHLHFGLQLIFDESQKDGNNEIWISCYELARFLSQNRSETVKDETTKEWHRVQELIDPAVTDFESAKNKEKK